MGFSPRCGEAGERPLARQTALPSPRSGEHMGELGIPELLIILAILLVLFGPSRLAGLGRTLGQGIREFRTSMRDETAKNESKAAADSEQPTAHA